MQSDNGREFKNKIIINLCSDKTIKVALKYERPYTPSDQGVIEQANSTLQVYIESFVSSGKYSNWVDALCAANESMNRTVRKPYRLPPYLFMFGCHPPTENDFLILAAEDNAMDAPAADADDAAEDS